MTQLEAATDHKLGTIAFEVRERETHGCRVYEALTVMWLLSKSAARIEIIFLSLPKKSSCANKFL